MTGVTARRCLWTLSSVAGAGLLLAACGSSPTTSTNASSPSTSTTAPPTSTTAPLSIAGPVLSASTTGGDSFRTNFTLREPQKANDSSVASTVASACRVDASRAVVVEMRLHTVATSSLREKVSISFQLAASNPGVGSIIMDYSDGTQCNGQVNVSTVSLSVAPGKPSTFTMWLVYPNVVTPRAPVGLDDQVALGKWLTQVSMVTIGGQSVDTEQLSGTRVVACGTGTSVLSTPYIVAAGELPQNVGDGLGNTNTCVPVGG